ncbi:MAG: GntR family transcriptional regulator [Spirochaetia bacterium]
MAPRKDLSQLAYTYLIDQFTGRELEPGNLIEPRDIARQLKISISPVNKALHLLAHEGFVKIIPRKGSFVENSNPSSLMDQMMLREAIECQAARIYCGSPVLENRDKLTQIAENLEKTPVSYQEHWKYEIEYHSLLVSLSGCSSLIRSFKNNIRLSLFLSINIYYEETVERQSHVELTESLTVNNPSKAEKIVREHLRSGKPAFLKNLQLVEGKSWEKT